MFTDSDAAILALVLHAPNVRGVENTTDRHRDPAKLRGTRLRVEEAPEWVVRHKIVNAPRADHEPVTLLLLDRQIHADRMMRYTRVVRRIETPQAVQEAGRIELDFDPATQQLLIHSISIFRDGELTNHAKLEDVEIIQRERDLEAGIYAGAITALVLLKDVRTGDVIDVESSIHSDDAIYPGHYWFLENFQHSIPVAAQFFHWTANDLSRFDVRSSFDDLKPTREETPFGERLTWERNEAPPLELEPNLPYNFNPFRHIALTSFRTWQEVAIETAALWNSAAAPGEELPKELEKIRSSHPEESEELIEALVAFVRDTIRYQGVEMGRLGLIPEELHTIWERRFGDCKEKTSLLCWLLRQCGFQATPALVSFGMAGRISEQVPGPIFDHVVVHLLFQDRTYWIDPTNISQRGKLDDWVSLPFEKAFLIDPDATEFLPIPPPLPESDVVRVNEEYTFRAPNTADISVKHEYRGESADRVRHFLEAQGRTAVQQFFTEIVKSTRSSAEITKDLTVEDDSENNVVTLAAEFQAAKVFVSNGPGQPHTCDFTPHSIVGKVIGVDDKPRKHPLGLAFPVNIEHSTLVRHPDAKGSIIPTTKIDNDLLLFEAGTQEQQEAPAFYYKFRTKVPEVPANGISGYRENLNEMADVISLLFHTPNVDADPKFRPGRKAGQPTTVSGWVGLVIIIIVLLAVIAGAVLSQS